MKILIVNLGGMGDFLLSLAAVSALRDFYKDSQIILLTIPGPSRLPRHFLILMR